MNWRFCERPGAPYTIYSVSDGSELAGYVVLKKWRDPDGMQKAHILDIHGVNAHALQELIAAAETYAVGCNEVNAWAVENYVYRECFETAGFSSTGNATQPVIAKTFDGTQWAFPKGRCSLSYGDGDSQY